MPVYSSSRSFYIFSYTISHGLLLLRSDKTDRHSSRVDILFQDVIAIESRMKLDKLTISEEEPSFLKGVRSNPAAIMEPGHKVYSLKCDGWTGYVVGGIMRVHEDDKNLFEPSYLLTDFSEDPI